MYLCALVMLPRILYQKVWKLSMFFLAHFHIWTPCVQTGCKVCLYMSFLLCVASSESLLIRKYIFQVILLTSWLYSLHVTLSELDINIPRYFAALRSFGRTRVTEIFLSSLFLFCKMDIHIFCLGYDQTVFTSSESKEKE